MACDFLQLMTYVCSEVDPLFKPVIDGTLLQQTPQEYLTTLSFPPVPYMTGTVRAEFGKCGKNVESAMVQYKPSCASQNR